MELRVAELLGWFVWYMFTGVTVFITGTIAAGIYSSVTFRKIGSRCSSEPVISRLKELQKIDREESRKMNASLPIRLVAWPIFLGYGFVRTIENIDQIRNEILKNRKNVEG